MTRLDKDLLNYQSKYLENEVLKNKLGIKDANKLEKVEREMTNFKLAKLYLDDSLSFPEGIKKFSPDHYLYIHKFLFNDIYDFAGEIRSENISKRIPFCPPQFIYNSLKDLLQKANNISSKIKSREELLDFITYLHVELDVIHPFREGNGRTLREFLRQYIKNICIKNNLDNYYLDFSLIEDKNQYINAVVKADAGIDYDSELRTLLDNILVTDKKVKIK